MTALESLPSSSQSANLAVAADRAGMFSYFLSAMGKAGLDALLTAPGQTTLFAPTDAAFLQFPKKTWADFERNQTALLRSILNCHFTKGRLTSSDLVGARTNANSFQGTPFVVEGDAQPRIFGATLTHMDFAADNGMLHGIDNVLWFAEQSSERPRGGKPRTSSSSSRR